MHRNIYQHRDYEQVNTAVNNATKFIALMRDDINFTIGEIEKSEEGKRNYGAAAWPYLQAHTNGNKEMLKAMINYLDNAEKQLAKNNET